MPMRRTIPPIVGRGRGGRPPAGDRCHPLVVSYVEDKPAVYPEPDCGMEKETWNDVKGENGHGKDSAIHFICGFL